MALTRHSKNGRHHHPLSAPIHQFSADTHIPCRQLPDHGIGEQMAYELLTNELLLDGQARLNLATFVTTWMPSLADRLMHETADKNMIDKDEYPQTAEIEARCVNIIADLWNADETEKATDCSTTGSSEAAMLAGLALKWRWREKMQAAGKPTDRPNLVTGSNVQVCWEKCCSLPGGSVRRRRGIIRTPCALALNALGTSRYWDVESRGRATGVLEA